MKNGEHTHNSDPYRLRHYREVSVPVNPDAGIVRYMHDAAATIEPEVAGEVTRNVHEHHHMHDDNGDNTIDFRDIVELTNPTIPVSDQLSWLQFWSTSNGSQTSPDKFRSLIWRHPDGRHTIIVATQVGPDAVLTVRSNDSAICDPNATASPVDIDRALGEAEEIARGLASIGAGPMPEEYFSPTA